MTRYFFDTVDGETVRDDLGLEFANVDDAKAEAIRALCEMAGEKMPRGDHNMLAVEVKDEGKRLVFGMRLVLEEVAESSR